MDFTTTYKAIREKFALSDATKQEYAAQFDKLRGSSDQIPLHVYVKNMTKGLGSYYQGKASQVDHRRVRRDLLKRRVLLLAKGDRNDDGKITKLEFLNNVVYEALMDSFNPGHNPDFDWTAEMSSSDFGAWLVKHGVVKAEAKKLVEESEKLAEQLKVEFSRDQRQGTVTVKVILDDIFDRCIPGDDTRVQEVVDKVYKHLLHGLDRKGMEAIFDKYCQDGEDFVTITKLESAIREQIDSVDEPGSQISDDKKDELVQKKVNRLKSKDRNFDGRVTKTEFLEDCLEGSLKMSLNAACGRDREVQRGELKHWLTSTLKMTENIEECIDSLMATCKPDGEPLMTETLIDFLFMCAFPSAGVKVDRVIDAIRQRYSLSLEAEKAKQDEYNAARKGQDTLTVEAYRDKLKADFMAENKGMPKFIVESYVESMYEAAEQRDLDKDGTISKDEFVTGQMYSDMLSSIKTYGEMSEGDIEMDRTELKEWLTDMCDLKGASYADAVIGEFLPQGESKIKIMELFNCLFNRAFPSPTKRVQSVAETIRRGVKLSDKAEKRALSHFNEMRKGKDFVTYALIEAYSKNEVEEDAARLSDALKKELAESLANIVKLRDRNQNGVITRTEFFQALLFIKMKVAMLLQGALDFEKFANWLDLCCKVDYETERNAKAVLDVVQPEDQDKLDANRIIAGVFNLAFPSASERVETVVKAVRCKFALCEETRKALEADFEKLSGGKDTISITDYEAAIRPALEKKFKNPRIHNRLVRNKVAALKKRDVNKDEKVSKKEYLIGEIVSKLGESLKLYGDNESVSNEGKDDVMDRDEFILWLAEVCKIYEDAYSDAVLQEFLKPNETEVKIQDLLDGLLDRAFPDIS